MIETPAKDIASLIPEVILIILRNLLIVLECFVCHHENLQKQNVTRICVDLYCWKAASTFQ